MYVLFDELDRIVEAEGSISERLGVGLERRREGVRRKPVCPHARPVSAVVDHVCAIQPKSFFNRSREH